MDHLWTEADVSGLRVGLLPHTESSGDVIEVIISRLFYVLKKKSVNFWLHAYEESSNCKHLYYASLLYFGVAFCLKKDKIDQISTTQAVMHRTWNIFE